MKLRLEGSYDEINEKFSGDLDVAQDFYLGNITKDDFINHC